MSSVKRPWPAVAADDGAFHPNEVRRRQPPDVTLPLLQRGDAAMALGPIEVVERVLAGAE
jgi:hypothetical protein